MKMTANILTLSRILFSLFLLVFPPYSSSFAASYLLCGATDALDGFAARKLNTESEKGAILDSMADLFFFVIYVVRILPLLSIPSRIWIWTAIIAIIKSIGIILASQKAYRLFIEHSFGNKLTGLLLFLLPLSAFFTDVKYGATLICIIAGVTAIKEIIKICGGSKDAV